LAQKRCKSTFSRKLFIAVGLAATLTADLPSWISTIEVRTKLEEIFYSTVTFGTNTLAWRKPPKETRPALTQQIQQAPADAQLYYLRAREAEAQLDFPAAEADWAKFTQIAPNRAQAWIDKADFHHRRAEPEKELAALLEAAKLPAAGAEIYRPVTAQQAWLALERAASLIPDHLLSDDRALDVLRAREARYPNEPQTYTRFAHFLATKPKSPTTNPGPSKPAPPLSAAATEPPAPSPSTTVPTVPTGPTRSSPTTSNSSINPTPAAASPPPPASAKPPTRRPSTLPPASSITTG
jgi:hypothetical protein